MCTQRTKAIDCATQFSQGYDAGNYAEAYDGRAVPAFDPGDFAGIRASHETAGYVLGFFSSYEIAEIPGDWVQVVTFLRHDHPEN